jgi:hypothetical protein
MTMKVTQKTTTTKTHRVEIGRHALAKALRLSGINVPDRAGVYVIVPGGGDWSNMQLDVDDKTPIVVSWTESSTVEE